MRVYIKIKNMATGFDTSSGTDIKALVSGVQVLDITSTGLNAAAIGSNVPSSAKFTTLTDTALSAANQLVAGGNTSANPIQQVAGGTATNVVVSTGPTSLPNWAVVPGSGTFFTPTATSITTNAAGSANGYSPAFSINYSLVAGDVYTVSAVAYTVLFSTTSLPYGVFTSAATPPPTGTWSRTSGTGPASIVVVAVQSIRSYSVPTSPRTPLYLYIRLIGGGGGGEGTYTTLNAGKNGTHTMMCTSNGAHWVFALGGQGGGSVTAGVAGQGGSSNSNGGVKLSITGQPGEHGSFSQVSSVYVAGGDGGEAGNFGQGANGGYSLPAGITAGFAGGLYGGGGGGSGFPQVINGYAGSGGGGAGYAEYLVAGSLSATWYVSIGQGGAAGAAPTSGHAGGAGNSGIVYIGEFYQ